MSFHVTIIHPCIGRHLNMKRYIKTWCMEPLVSATLAALLPDDCDSHFFDDRLETIDYDIKTDLVAISIETYTARRCYQIASEFRLRGIPVVMGGFHASLCPDEVAIYADSVVIGEAEENFPQLIDDYRSNRPQKIYRADKRPALRTMPDRSIFADKTYLPITLIESVRGCRFKCDFCAIQQVFNSSTSRRPVDQVLEEARRLKKGRQLYFFIDDNITSDLAGAKELFRALAPLNIRWVSQSSINVAYDEEALRLMKASGCQGILVGFESLDRQTLHSMNKDFNLMKGGPAAAMENFRRHGIRVYGTFVFGYDHDSGDSFDQAVNFAKEQGMFIAAFNHLTPFPGTPLYKRLEDAGRLMYEQWWLDSRYRYNGVPFYPKQLSPDLLTDKCISARRSFYSWSSIARRSLFKVQRQDTRMLLNYWLINAMHRKDIDGRNGLPMGDLNWNGELIPA